MKKIHLIIATLCICCCLLAFTSCKSSRLDSPSGLTLNADTLVLSWDKVENARYYKIVLDKEGKDDETRESTKASIDLSKLDEGSYSITVIACSNADEWRDSRPSKKISFVREHEAGYVFSLIDRGSAYALTSIGSAESKSDGTFIIPETYRGKLVTEIAEKAFFNRSSVKKVVLSNNISRIGKQAFANCTNLASVEFASGLTAIETSAFQACKGLTGELKIPDSVTELGEYAFAGCEKITSLSIGKGIKSISANCFLNCKGLKRITIPQNVQTIEEYAFSDNYAVEEVVIENGLQSIGDYSFAHNRALKKVTVADSVTAIGEGAFTYCEELANITFGVGVSSVGANAFYKSGIFNQTPTGQPVYVANWLVGYNTLDDENKAHPELVTSVELRDGTVGIADEALLNHGGFATVKIPSSVKVVGYKAFANCKINTLELGGGVTAIGERAFYKCESLQLAVLGKYNELSGVMTESNLEKIGDYAFYGCKNLKQIKIPQTVTEIGCYAFRNTSMYTSQSGIVYAAEYDSVNQKYIYDGAWVVDNASATMSSTMSVKEGTVGIGNYSFYKCGNLEALTIPQTVKYIGRSAFYLCESLEDVNLPANIKRIEDYTFYNCSSLKRIELPQGLEYIGRSAFYKARLGSVDADTQTDVLIIPDAVTYIGDYAFYNTGFVNVLNADDESEEEIQEIPCGIDKLVIGNGVTYIGSRAFYGSVALKEVIFGNELTTLGERAFYNCKLLKTVTFPEDSVLQTIGGSAFYGCVSLEKAILPHSVETVGEKAFYKCGSLVELDLGSVKNIEKAAFYGCESLTSLHIPQTVAYVGEQAFRNCTGLAGVAIESDETVLDVHSFYGCKNMTVYTDASAEGENWKLGWNSTFCPIVWGCTLSADGTYVQAVTKTESFAWIKDISKQLTPPARSGYEFCGWAYTPDSTAADISMEELLNAEDGTTLYAVWREITTV